ncbi:HAMP domain-containing sensor histidine kinase [Flavobacterium sp.]|uniref:sensor histidine kinase n=1 Tax=Flavobacterium sp. TaxID=239 RepID=UPI00260D25E1|nr:HAMP domain-containing sensor histidine kinase [Flavobacterium sp.]MDD2985702.1 HAMP domain-containing sensor histidine kinase [Flavobacterium sp.]
MKFTRLNSIIFVGLLSIVGVLIMQLLMLNRAYSLEKKDMEDKIHFALQDVVKRIYRDNKTELTITNQIKKITDDYYIVNIDDVFEHQVLEYYLKSEFQKVKLGLDYEYAIYNCGTDEMIYGNYVSDDGKNPEKCENCFPKNEALIYYFGIRFPDLQQKFITSLGQYWIYTGILFFVLIIYVYSVFLLLKQKKYTELQTDFINNMTHEFKTPLSSILIASQYASSQEEIISNPKLAKYMQIIINQSHKLNHHIERILNVAKGDAKWIELDIKEINLKETLELVKENALLKSSKQSTITIEIPTNCIVLADEFHFYNILINIVDNAIKYSGDAPLILIKSNLTSKGVTLSFSDQGTGIANQHLEYVFDKFYRVPRENKKDIEGFGIGLFYVKKIVDLHHWKIKIINNEGPGITVSILIPKKDIV